MQTSHWVICLVALWPLTCSAQAGWWIDEPIRLIQTNLRETDSNLDPARLASQLSEFHANTLLFGMGGIVAHFPTGVEFHYPSPYLPPGRDLFGEMLREAHARGIRVIGRFDFSKTQKTVFDAHPEWFFRRANGEPVAYNGLYSACINGGYYRQHIFKILSEALERYQVDGLFFNMFGNPSSDYSGKRLGLCHCASCAERFQALYRRELPSRADLDYREFMRRSSREVAARIAELIHSRRPGAAFLTYIQEHVDGIMSESNTSLSRPLPLWPYSASDRVNRTRNSQPSKMAFNLCIGFVDIPYRMVTVSQPEVRLRLFQNMAHGSGPMFVALGTLDQEDQNGLKVARSVFQWHAEHEEYYVKQESAARVLLLGGGGPSYRGFFRLLTEQHIPFVVSDNLGGLENHPKRYDLVISPMGAPRAVDRYVRQGGRLLVAGATRPELELPKVIRRWEAPETHAAYWRIQDHKFFPSLKDTQLLFLAGEYLELEPQRKPLLTLVPPSLFGPPEKVFTDKVETQKPGLILSDLGKGKFAYLPWDVGGLYYRHSSPGHGGLVADLIDHLLPAGRQLETNAHPLVEITVMRQKERGRTLIHLVNLSGHSQTAYFNPIRMDNLRVKLTEEFQSARSLSLATDLTVKRSPSHHEFTLPHLETYDVVVLE